MYRDWFITQKQNVLVRGTYDNDKALLSGDMSEGQNKCHLALGMLVHQPFY